MKSTKPSDTVRSRHRLPGIEQLGYAQLSVIETALWPLANTVSQNVFETGFSYTNKEGSRERARVEIAAIEPLKPNDDYVLWALLSLVLRHSQNNVLTAPPYWLLKQLGMPTGGHDYALLRGAVERLARVMYHCSAFYNPLSQEHERWTFSFFSSHLPTSLDSDRLWKLVWNEPFIQISRATGGRMMFDLELFRKLGSPAARRLFLKLTDRFYRSNRVHLDLEDLTINGLGYAPSVPLKRRKQMLTQCIETLAEHGIVALGRGHHSTKELFWKRGKGSYVVVFYRGPYYEQPLVEVSSKKNPADDPLHGPMLALGIDAPMITKLLRKSSRGLLERWLRITEAAMKEKPAGFPGFKVSPAAFFVDGVLNERTPPDWMYQLEKRQRQRTYEAQAAQMKAAGRLLQIEYERERTEALKMYLHRGAGRELYKMAFQARLAFNKAQGEPEDIARRIADDEARQWVSEADEFAFPDFSVWTLAQPQKAA
jgi:hypothetical protein